MSATAKLLPPYTLFVGFRYSFSRKRNRFTSVIALVSMLGMVLGVASLIAVLSVMNGFSGELRSRILSLVPHGFVLAQAGTISSWQSVRDQLLVSPGVVAAAPYISQKVILSGASSLRGAQVNAIAPAYETGVSDLAGAMVAGDLSALEERRFSIVLGASLARLLGVGMGDSVQVTVPRLAVTPVGTFPRTKRLLVVGLFEVGAQPDTYQAYVSLDTGQRLLGMKGEVEGLQVRTADLYEAPLIMRQLLAALPGEYRVKDWSETQGSLFQAVKMEKIMVSLLLLCVVAVAAFNIVSTLVMSVAEKRSDIAVLRTMGARSRGVMTIFMAHGLWLATVGITLGVVLGVLIASYIAPITAFFENLLGVKLFDPAVYFISELPSQLMWQDVLAVALASAVLSLIATLYPAWRASRVAPAEVLRYE